ncbi:succinate--CoA ligase subunit alpha [Oleidesulfovibrio sp.]|uniref:succinate--CoA ligase subunit alpha n=1 Tax=Oleidesulfovibrio sp. TaxID=2909707 RepID=UPI003A8AFC9B
MFLNEHMSKLLFAEAGLDTPAGDYITPDALQVYTPSVAAPWYLKAQVLTGGRGKAGGIRRADTPEELQEVAKQIFAMTIKGHNVPFLRVESATDIRKECYLSFVLSRERRDMLLTTSRAGGIHVESSSEQEKPLVQRVPLDSGLRDHHLRAAFFELGVEKEHWAGFKALAEKLYKAVREYGLLMAEINPLVLTGDGKWVALDGKVELDDTVVDLRTDFERFYTPEHHSREEVLAREAGLSYVELKGWVGILVNGAGLAMATMDLLNFSGLSAANFMDLGGAADAKRMRRALDLLFENKGVRAVFINLFGGIVSCADVARALMEALGEGDAPKPIVVRMAGHESEEGRALLHDFAHPSITIAQEMSEALDALRTIQPVDVPHIEFSLPDEPEAAPRPVVQESACGPEKKPAIGLNAGSGVLVQGLTGKVAQRHAKLMMEYGTKVVAGVTPFKGGQEVLGIPVYDSVHEACRHHNIDASIIFVPAAFAPDAVLEAAAEEIPWVVCITEGIPQAAMLSALKNVAPSPTMVVGPNTPGIVVPEQMKIGIMPGYVFSSGPVAIFSRSGTLTYEAASRLTNAGIGQSVCVGVGGDSFVGTSFVDLCERVRYDDATKAVLVLGEVGGRAEEELAAYVTQTRFPKPVVSFVAARTAPPGRRLGHAGAILDEKSGGVEGKLQAMREAGFTICPDLASLPQIMKRVLGAI